MRGKLTIWLLFMSLQVPGSASPAAGTTVTLQGDDGHGEVCRFAAGGGGDPFQGWLSSQAVTCVASGSSIEFPAGRWNVFARSASAVSADPIVVDGASAPESLNISLVPAARLAIQLPAGQTGILYAPKHAAAFPAAGTTSVPAGEEVWLFVLLKSAPVDVVVIPPTEAGAERVVDTRKPGVARSVLGWLQLPDADRAALKTAHNVALPHLRIASTGKETGAASLPSPDRLDGALVLWGGVDAGDSEVRLTGRGWLPLRNKIKVGPQQVTLLRQPIVARASATLVVNWSTADDLAALDRSFGSCEPPQQPPPFELRISSCSPGKSGEAVDAASCQTVRTEPLLPQASFGSVTIEEVPPGLYRAELRFGKLPPVTVTTPLEPLQQQPIRVQAFYVQAYGSLTRGGQPLGEEARIEFPRGGVGFLAHDSDEYHAVLTGDVGADAKIEIVTCRGERTLVLSDKPMMRKARFDIDIPDNLLTVRVIDTFTHAPLGSATLGYTVMSASMPRFPLFTRTLSQGESTKNEPSSGHGDYPAGQFVIKAVPQRELRIQASNPGYKKQDLDPFSITKSEKKEIEIELVPLKGSQGKIVSSHPFEKAMVFWFAAGGVETEHADLAADGSFTFEGTHLRDETMTVVSSSHPLWIARAAAVERGRSLEVRFPDGAPVRNAEVALPSMPVRLTTLIGVAIGGLRVPTPALVQHLALRETAPLVRGGGPIEIAALAETGFIDILRGPTSFLSGPAALRDFAVISSRRLEPGNDQVMLPSK
jgi:hypothetical protein